MNVAITIQHPAHVHFFRHAVDELVGRGHDVRVFARAKDIAPDLLAAYGIPYTPLAGEARSTLDLLRVQPLWHYRLYRAARRFDPDVLAAIGGLAAAQVAPLVGARSVAFLDTEGALVNRLTAPLADVVCTPRGFRTELRGDHRRYDGYHELAYLHPDRFTPDLDALADSDVDPDARVFVLRFARWAAHHDVGHAGFSRGAKRRLVDLLDARGDVYITWEGRLPGAFEDHRLPVPPHRLHDLLSVADLYVGDSGTMATEAAVLGTPAVRSSSHAGADDMSNFRELEAEYGLLHSREDEGVAIELVRELLGRGDLRAEWARRRDRLLADKIDVTDFVVETIVEVGAGGAT